MFRFIIVALFVFLQGCDGADSVAQDLSLLIRVTSENEQAMSADNVQWWYTNQPKKKLTLSCSKEPCVEWAIQRTTSQPITVAALATQDNIKDPLCSDFFEGEVEVQPHELHTKIVLFYSATACQ